MYKKILYILIFGFLSSCTDFLDRPKPEATIPLESAFNTVEDLSLTLTGAYRVLTLSEIQLILYPDFISDNSTYNGPFGFEAQISIPDFSPNSDRIRQFWVQSYEAINLTNIVLEGLEKLPNAEAKIANQIKGETLFLRGFAHFEMVRLYSQPYGSSANEDLGIPIMLKATTKISDLTFPERASVQAVYDQVIQDVTEAIDLLDNTYTQGRVNRFVALAYLARIYFQMRDYEKAAQYAQEVIQGPFRLNNNPKEFFEQEGTPEEIWKLTRAPQNPGTLQQRSQNFIPATENMIQDGFQAIITTKQSNQLLDNNLMAEDLRFTSLTAPIFSSVSSLKYQDPVSADDAPILRIAEPILMRAEALVRLNGINSESIELLNAIRTRSLRITDTTGTVIPNGDSFIEFEVADFSSAEELIEAIILERRVEFFFEGNRFHDLMRLQRPLIKPPLAPIDYDACELRWPIPQSEINANNKLIQNPDC